MKRISISILTFVAVAVAVLILAAPLYAEKPPLNLDKNGVAIKGYDAVAYFTMGKAVKGMESLSLDWNGATWRFATEEHRSLFRADPERYAPQYGGY